MEISSEFFISVKWNCGKALLESVNKILIMRNMQWDNEECDEYSQKINGSLLAAFVFLCRKTMQYVFSSEYTYFLMFSGKIFVALVQR